MLAARQITDTRGKRAVVGFDELGMVKALAVDPDWSSWTPPTLETEVFSTATAYDALNRPTSVTTPDASEIKPTYNEAGLLEAVEVHVRGASTATSFVADIDYNAKGQREAIVYGNGTTTAYSYDPLTFRLTQLVTTRTSDSAVLQDLTYTYDPVDIDRIVGEAVERHSARVTELTSGAINAFIAGDRAKADELARAAVTLSSIDFQVVNVQQRDVLRN